MNLTPKQTTTLLTVGRGRPLPLSTFADPSGTVPPKVRKHLDRLVERGLLEQHGDDTLDVTTAGFDALEAAGHAVADLRHALPRNPDDPGAGEITPDPIDQSGTFEHLPVDSIAACPFQMRRFTGNDAEFTDLVADIKSRGVIQPILVRPIDGGWQLVAGERRLRASRAAGRATVPAYVRSMSDDEAMHAVVVENLRRKDLEPLEEAHGVLLLLSRDGATIESVAATLDMSPSWVARHAGIARLIPLWQDALRDPDRHFHHLGVTHLEHIARLPEDLQRALLDDPGHQHLWWRRDSCQPDQPSTPVLPTVSSLDRAIDTALHRLANAPWSLDDDSLVPDVGACSACPRRTGADPLLWDSPEDDGSGDHCLDAACWDHKLRAHVLSTCQEVEEEHGTVRLVHLSAAPPEPQGDSDPLAEHLASAAYYYDFETASGPDDDGAVPCVQLDGAQPGTLQWRRPKGGRTSTPDGAPTPLKVRKEKHERRRTKRAIELGIEALDEPSLRMPAEALYPLLAVFGTRHRASSLRSSPACLDSLSGKLPKGLRSNDPWKLVEHLSAADHQDHLLGLLWGSLLPVLKERWIYTPAADVKRQWKELATVAGFLGLDTDRITEQARAELPNPKIWANLNPDGTPKSAAKSEKSKPSEKAAA